jgi:hypothetical protein
MSSGKQMQKHHVQWAAQFATAAELCKRGYDVSFTMGNATPIADLRVVAPSGVAFSIDVKGQRTANFWRIKAQSETAGLFYVLCFVTAPNKLNRFFVLSQRDVSRLMSEYALSGVRFKEEWSGFNWTTAYPYEDRWDTLPACKRNQ